MKIIADVSLQTITLSEIDSSDKNLYFGFTDKGSLPVKFNDLSFGLSVLQDSVSIFEDSFPKEGTLYDLTDQDFLVSTFLNVVKLGTPYTLKVWVQNDKDNWEEEFDIILPRWDKPFESWIWNETNDCWMSSISYPENGKNYEWDEDKVEWILVDIL